MALGRVAHVWAVVHTLLVRALRAGLLRVPLRSNRLRRSSPTYPSRLARSACRTPKKDRAEPGPFLRSSLDNTTPLWQSPPAVF